MVGPAAATAIESVAQSSDIMKLLTAVAGLVWIALAATPHAALDWPQFRGPNGAGVADGAALPERWSATQNVAWAVEVPGRGWSSPILWRDRIFLTTAISPGAFKAPSTGIFGNDYAAELEKQGLSDDEILKRVVNRDIELAGETGEIRYMVLALRKSDGKVLWQQEAHRGLPPGGRHRKNTYASETPVTDGERLYASFGGNVGVFCYTLDGTLLWKHTWPPQPIYLDFGTASSPIVHNGTVYQLHDNDGDSFLAALDAKTGKEIWTVKRKELASRMASGWASPFVWENGQRTEIVTIGRGFVISYDTAGRELWRLKGMTQATPSPVAADGLLYVGSGSQGEANRPLLAVRPGGSGDITPGEADKSALVAWSLPRFSGYTTSPLVYRGRVYAVNDNGVLQVADAKTGTEIYKARVGGGGRTFSSSPLASEGRIYCLSEDGEAIVFRAGDRYDEIAQNQLGEMSLATPAADSDSLYVRTQTKLYRIRGAVAR
jgi:outer membrane protein assembly factor BamB